MTWLGTYARPTYMSLPHQPPLTTAEVAVARQQELFPTTALASWSWDQQQLQEQHLQPCFPLNSLVHVQDSTLMEQQAWTNTAEPVPGHWLPPEKELRESAPNTSCQKLHSNGTVQVPGVGLIKKSDLVLLRAVHKGELDVDDERAPDISMLTPDQLEHLEAFLNTAEDRLWRLGLSLLNTAEHGLRTPHPPPR